MNTILLQSREKLHFDLDLMYNNSDQTAGILVETHFKQFTQGSTALNPSSSPSSPKETLEFYVSNLPVFLYSERFATGSEGIFQVLSSQRENFY